MIVIHVHRVDFMGGGLILNLAWQCGNSWGGGPYFKGTGGEGVPPPTMQTHGDRQSRN